MMANDDWKYKSLPRVNGEVPPLEWDEDKKDWDVYTGGDNTDVVAELESIKATQNEILERLDNPIDTRLTGSNVEEVFLEDTVVPSDSDARVILEVFGSKVGIGINIIPVSKFYIGYEDYPKNRATSAIKNIFEAESNVNRGSGFIEPTAKTIRLRVVNTSDEEIDIKQLVVTNFN